MTRQLEGLWIGGAISEEAAIEVAEAVWEARHRTMSEPARTELTNLANAIRAQLQRLPPVPKPDPARYL